jgi:flagellar FliJ protein
MKAYKFPLASVLRVRRIQEEQARAALMHANRLLTQAQQEVTDRLDHLRSTSTGSRLVSRQAFQAQQVMHELQAGAVRYAQLRRDEARIHQEETRESWSTEAKRVSSLERLDERMREEYNVELNRDDARRIDDLVTSRYVRRNHE